eukprot:31197-Pelagococcus_subviridis.AAC.7
MVNREEAAPIFRHRRRFASIGSRDRSRADVARRRSIERDRFSPSLTLGEVRPSPVRLARQGMGPRRRRDGNSLALNTPAVRLKLRRNST